MIEILIVGSFLVATNTCQFVDPADRSELAACKVILNRFRCVPAVICAGCYDVFANLAVFDPSLLKMRTRSVEKVLLVWVPALSVPSIRPRGVFDPPLSASTIEDHTYWLWTVSHHVPGEPDHINPSSPIGIQNGRVCGGLATRLPS